MLVLSLLKKEYEMSKLQQRIGKEVFKLVSLKVGNLDTSLSSYGYPLYYNLVSPVYCIVVSVIIAIVNYEGHGVMDSHSCDRGLHPG